jgi:hypothetical protein
MRDGETIEQVRTVMEERLERDDSKLLSLFWASKRDALGAIVNDGQNPVEMDMVLDTALATQDMPLSTYIKVQAARNVVAWVTDETDEL